MTQRLKQTSSSLLSLLLGLLLLLQPIAFAASSCSALELFAPGSCCCTPAEPERSAESSCCAARESPRGELAPVRRSAAGGASFAGAPAGCDCDVDAPPSSGAYATASGPRDESTGPEALARWLADGALRSMLAAHPASLHGPPPWTAIRRPGSLDAAAQRCALVGITTLGCARMPLLRDGARGLSAALSIARC